MKTETIVMKAHFKKDGMRIVLHFTIATSKAFIEEQKILLSSGWIQVSPDME